MLDAYYRIATPLLMGNYSIMNDAKISVKPTWQTSKRIGEDREKRGGLGRDERFSPLPLPQPFFFVWQRPRIWIRGRLIKENKEPEMDGQENMGVVLRKYHTMFLHKARAAAAWPCAEKCRQSKPKNSSTDFPSYKKNR